MTAKHVLLLLKRCVRLSEADVGEGQLMADIRNSTRSRVAHAAATAGPGAGNRFRNCASALEGCALPTKLFPRVRQSTNVSNRHEWPARYLSRD